jgi:myo-inositol-1(or 4)-monophosphatase
MPTDLTRMCDLAVRAARIGGEVIEAGAGSRQSVDKGLPGDYVTEVDLASERSITVFLSGESPDVPVKGEESDGHPHGDYGDRYWVVDPLDGTTNFMHGFPAVGVSVALVEDGRPVAGCVHAPFLGQTYAAVADQGAWVQDDQGARTELRVSSRPIERAVVGTGFPFRRKELLARYLRVMGAALERFEDLRRPGAACLDLAWVAAGVFDGFFELSLAPWDVAAGGLLIQESGGVVSDWKGGSDWLTGNILAGPPAIHAELVRLTTLDDGVSTAT